MISVLHICSVLYREHGGVRIKGEWLKFTLTLLTGGANFIILSIECGEELMWYNHKW